MKQRAALFSMALVATAVLGCADQGPSNSLTGVWVGFDGNRKVTLVLEESDDQIDGHGVILSPRGEIVVLGGVRLPDEIIIDVRIDTDSGSSQGYIAGIERGSVFTGRLEGASFSTDSIRLIRYVIRR